MDVGGGELLVIIFVILLLFGSDKIPEIARGLGKGINEFKRATDEIKREITTEADNLTSATADVKSDGIREIRELKNSVSTSFSEIDQMSVKENIAETPVIQEISSNKKSGGKTTTIIDLNDGSGI